ncbi:MAG: carboxypeptidase regulatory-like domain-containing protein [Anaerotruncus sp.]|nr:carboxypeptidase regulatory-like domain-containing protein [Anaerotruncus sp.]
MKKLLSILLALCVLSTVAVPAFATEQPDSSIYLIFKIVDPLGNPVPNAVVFGESKDDGGASSFVSSNSNCDGLVSVSDVIAGNWSFTVNATMQRGRKISQKFSQILIHAAFEKEPIVLQLNEKLYDDTDDKKPSRATFHLTYEDYDHYDEQSGKMLPTAAGNKWVVLYNEDYKGLAPDTSPDGKSDPATGYGYSWAGYTDYGGQLIWWKPDEDQRIRFEVYRDEDAYFRGEEPESITYFRVLDIEQSWLFEFKTPMLKYNPAT